MLKMSARRCLVIIKYNDNDGSCAELKRNDVNPLNEGDIYDLRIRTSQYRSLSGKTKKQHLFLGISKVN